MRCESSAVHGPMRTASISGAWEGHDPREARTYKPRLPCGVCRNGRSDRGGEHTCGPAHERMTTASQKGAVLQSLHGHGGAPTRSQRGASRCRGGSNGYMPLTRRRGRGPSTSRPMRREHVGQVLVPAGADRNLPRPTVRGSHRGGGRGEDWRLPRGSGAVAASGVPGHVGPANNEAPVEGNYTAKGWMGVRP